MLLTLTTSVLIAVLTRVSGVPVGNDVQQSEDSLRDGIGPHAAIYDAIANFQESLAKMIKDIDFFDSSALNPVNWPLDNLSYDKMSKQLILSASYSAVIDVVPSVVTMHSIGLEIHLSVDDGDIFHPSSSLSLSLKSYVVSGLWTVGSISFHLSVKKDGEKFLIEGSPQPPKVSINSFFTALGHSNFLPEGMESVLSSNAGLNSFSLERTEIKMLYSKSLGCAISLSGNPTVAGWGSFSMNVTLQQPVGSDKDVFIMTVQFSSFSLSSLVSQLTGIDISGVPIIGPLTLPAMELVIATDKPSQLLLANAEDVEKGVALVTSFSLGSNSQSMTYTVSLSESKVTFEVDGGFQSQSCLTVGELLNALFPSFDSSSFPLPSGVPNVFNIAFKNYYYDPDTKSVGVTSELVDEIKLVPGLVTVSNTYITVVAKTTSNPIKLSLSGGADWTFGDKTFDITIKQVDDGDGYVVRGECEFLNVGNVLTQLGATILPSNLESILENSGLGSFRIESPVVQVPLGRSSDDFEMFLTGKPVVAEWSGVTLDAAVVRADASTAMAIGFEFVDTNFAGLIKSLTGVSVKFISLLDRSLETAVIISPRTMTDISLSGSLLSQLQVKKGVSVMAAFSVPDKCNKDLLCLFVTSALGAGAELQLRATITSLTKYVIAAAVSDVSLGRGLTLSEAALEFQIGTETSAGISGTLDLSNPDLTFVGAVRLGTEGLQLSMKMEGAWKNAFGIEWLVVDNVIISMSIKPGVPLSGLELGAEVRIGTEAEKELVGQAYIGFDPVVPSNNYYYASISSASIQDILDAFGMSVSIPRPLADSGFPKGLSSSFSLEEQEPVPGVIIPSGCKLNGTINILGYEMSADISLSPPTQITIDINMDPLNLANGLFKLYRSKDDPNKGPLFYANLKPPAVTLRAEGYARVLNMIEQSAYLEITNTQYIMNVTGSFFGFEATLKVYATYGSLQSAAFQVYGQLSSRWKTEIKNQVQKLIEAGADKATKEIDKARKDVDKFRGELGRVSDNLTSSQRAVNNLCSRKSCRTISLCKAANVACSAKRDVALAALKTAKFAVNAAKKSLDSATLALSAAKATYRAGSEAAAEIIRLGLGGLISIDEIEFDVAIGVASSGQFSGSTTVSFLGRKSETFSFDLRLESVSSMAENLAEKMFPRITK